jgi:hypothetical protein
MKNVCVDGYHIFIAHEMHLRAVSFGHFGEEGEGGDMNYRVYEQFQFYSLV